MISKKITSGCTAVPGEPQKIFIALFLKCNKKAQEKS
jgi:hypothetical protein